MPTIQVRIAAGASFNTEKLGVVLMTGREWDNRQCAKEPLPAVCVPSRGEVMLFSPGEKSSVKVPGKPKAQS